MAGPRWELYSDQVPDIIANAVKVSDPEKGKVVLVARARVEVEGTGSTWLFGEFHVGDKYAYVYNLTRAFQVEEFEVGPVKEVIAAVVIFNDA